MKFFFIFVFLTFPLWAQNSLTYFNSYEDNKKAFIEKAGSHFFQSWPIDQISQITSEMTSDLAKYNSDADQILVISSGLHGIEGYVGSAIQRALMDRVANKKLKYDILFIHSLNPWGMKNKRRTNEKNIDMNRNFSHDGQIFEQKNSAYLQIKSFLNPEDQLHLEAWHKTKFILKSVWLILKYSMETLRNAVLSGQYSESRGIYFGGFEESALQERIDQLFEKDLKKYRNIIWVDLHTGYGQKGHLHLLANDPEAESSKNLEKLFSPYQIDYGNQEKFYTTTGDMTSYLNAKSTDVQKVFAIVFEYGTLDTQKTFGSIESLRRIVVENQGFHYGYKTDQDKAQAQQLFSDMFFPQDVDWQNSVLKQTIDILSIFLTD